MAVHFDTDNINNLYPATEIKREPVTVPVNKKDLKDFFPRTEKNFLGFFRQMDFKNKLQRNISEVYELMKSSWLEADKNKEQDGDKASQKLIAFQRANYWERFDIELKNRILHRLQNEDWRTYEKLNMADDMYDMSSNSFKSAAIETGVFATGYGMSKMKLIKTSYKKPVTTINVDQELHPKPHTVSFTKTFNNVVHEMGWYSNHHGIKGKTLNVKLKQDFDFTFNGKERIVTLMDVDAISTELRVAETLNTQKHETFDCMAPLGIMGFVAGFNPYIGIASTIVNVGFNTALGYKYREIADRMQNLENKSNEKDNDFNSQITNSICEDFKALNFDEIHNLIKYLGIE